MDVGTYIHKQRPEPRKMKETSAPRDGFALSSVVLFSSPLLEGISTGETGGWYGTDENDERRSSCLSFEVPVSRECHRYVYMTHL